ncbi:MAG: glycosyltransferase [Elusimicrobia bacterium]|nr:glycosyltransferase [Elusimicrobiota bacterium]
MTSYTIYHLDGERTLRGGERQLLYLACALRARKHRNVVVCRKGSLLALEADRLGLEAAFLPFLGEWDPLSAVALRHLVGRGGGDVVVHSHTAHTAALSAMACGRMARVAHRRVDFELNTGLSRRLKYDHVGAVVAVSSAIKDILVRCGMRPEGISVVPDAIPVGPEECRWARVDREYFAPATPEARRRSRLELAERFGVEPDLPWVGNLAALVPHKDHDTLIAAAFLALRRNPDLRFIIAGDGPLQPELLGQIKRMDLIGKVWLVGRLDDAMPFLKSVDVLAHSSWGEGMGSVLLEASSCKIPIAATTAGGIPEVIEDGRTGLLVPPRDPEALAGAVLRLVDDKGLAGALSTAARCGLSKFSLANMASKMESIYDKVN